jgi:glycine/D-amino acid oxidase-like deaminating enzyme
VGGPRVVVVGGGIVGFATAAFLARGGARVTLLEREAVGAGASGRNSGSIQRPFDRPMIPLYEETLALHRAVARERPASGFRLGDAPAGLLLATHRPAVARALGAHLAGEHPDLGIDVLEPAELRAVEPGFAEGVAAVRVPVGYPVVPAQPTYAWAGWAESLGVTIRIGRAASLEVGGGRVTGVRTGERVEPADAVVVAAGPWTSEIVDPTGIWRPVVPLYGVVADVLLPDPPRHVIEEAEMDAALGTGDVVAGVMADVAGEVHDPEATPQSSVITAAGVSCVGSTFLTREPDPDAWTERLLVRAATFIPAIADAPIRETRACARPLAFDGRPMTGRIPWLENAFVAAGHGPWGISTGPASGRQVADLALGREVRIDPAFDPARYPARP